MCKKLGKICEISYQCKANDKNVKQICFGHIDSRITGNLLVAKCCKQVQCDNSGRCSLVAHVPCVLQVHRRTDWELFHKVRKCSPQKNIKGLTISLTISYAVLFISFPGRKWGCFNEITCLLHFWNWEIAELQIFLKHLHITMESLSKAIRCRVEKYVGFEAFELTLCLTIHPHSSSFYCLFSYFQEITTAFEKI